MIALLDSKSASNAKDIDLSSISARLKKDRLL